jgi:hypothetical protein
MSDIGEQVIDWGTRDRTLRAMLIIGSRSNQSLRDHGFVDERSDWDFYIVSSNIYQYSDAEWLKKACLPDPIVYVNRMGRLGHAHKVSAVFESGELDLVLIPARQIIMLSWLMKVGCIEYVPRAKVAWNDIGVVLRAGYRLLKGGHFWRRLFRDIASSEARLLCSKEICELANGFVCDYVSVFNKIERGEFIAAQRWLHANLAEVNFRLLHELRLRRGDMSFPDARRLEKVVDERWLNCISINAVPNCDSLHAALEKSAETLRVLIYSLVGTSWKWPNVSRRTWWESSARG